MPIAAVPKYLGQNFNDASPGMRFGMYLKLWGVNERTSAALWQTHDIAYEIRGQNREEREVKKENKVSALSDAKRLNDRDKSAMKALADRQSALAATLPEDHLLHLLARATAPFTTGLGNEHPLENGFAFLNPYGLPYLPGSGVKGVLRQAARELASGEWGETHGWSEEKTLTLEAGKDRIALSTLDALFGLESGDGDTQHVRGALTFWDVIPQIKGNSLMVEIMTPHQGHYYQQNPAAGSTSPHDSGQPIPISFLTVPPGAGFTFFITCDTAHLDRLAPELARDGRWKTLIQAALEHAFAWLGFGAKTAVGYGAMRRDEEAESRAAKEQNERKDAEDRQAALAAMSPNLQEIEKLRAEIEQRLAARRKLPVSDQFWGGRIKKLALAAVVSTEWNADEKRALANMLEKWAGQLMALDPKALSRQLKLAMLRGLAG